MQPIAYANGHADPVLVGNPLVPEGLKQRKITQVTARIEVAADGRVTEVIIKPDTGVPADMIAPLGDALKKAGLFVPAVDNGKFVAGTYNYHLEVAPSPQTTTNTAILHQDARWNEYSEYLREVEKTVEQQWYRILKDSRVSPPRDSHVTITFRITSKGETNIIKVDDAGSSKQGVWSCQSAIEAGQPYRKWSNQMISVLGDEQTLVFGFYYQ